MKKKQGAEDTKAHHRHENFGLHELLFPCFLAFARSRKYQRKSSTLKHAVVK